MSDSLFQNPAPDSDAPSQAPHAASPFAQPAAADPASLQEQVRGLQRLLLAVLVVTLFLSGVLNLFFLRQMIPARKELAALRPRVHQLVSHYEQNQGPAVQQFVNQLQNFARSHPDFAQILAKYNLAPGAPAANQPAGQ